MPLKQSATRGKEHTCTIDFGEAGSLNVTFDMSAFTPRMEQEVAEADPTCQSPTLAKVLSRLILRWDYIGPKGKPVPTDPETLLDEPSEFLWTVFNRMADTLVPPPKPAESTSSFA